MGLLRQWGFGAELFFKSDKAKAGMIKARRTVVSLKKSFSELGEAGSRVGRGMTTLATLITPLGLGFGFAATQASSLAGNLEAQKLTMRVLLGDVAKADELLGKIRENAAATPFAEGDLIEGSKRLLRLTGDNVDKNIDLLKVMETMSALNPGKSVVDAVEGLLDATSGGGFERLKEFGLSFKAEDFKALGRPGGKAWADGVTEAIKVRMAELTRGEDLVGALSQTFGGRSSTFQDSLANILKGIGGPLNAAVGPALVRLTDLINGAAPDIIEGFRLAFAQGLSIWQTFGQPVFDSAVAAWEAMGTSGRQNIARVVAILGTLSALFVPLAAVIAVAVTTGKAFLTILSALIPLGSAALSMITAITTVISAVGASTAPVIAVVAVALGVVAGVLLFAGTALTAFQGAVVATFATLASRSAQLSNILPAVFDDMTAGFGARLSQLGTFFTAFGATFRSTFGPLVDIMLRDLQPAFDSTIEVVFDLMEQLGMVSTTTADASSAGVRMAQMASGILAPALDLVSLTIRSILAGMRFMLPLITSVSRGFSRMTHIIFGLGAGGDQARDAMSLLLLTVQSLLLGTTRAIVGTMVQSLDFVLAAIQTSMAALGLGDLLNLGSARDRLASISSSVDDRLAETIAGIDQQASAIEQRRLDAGNVSVTMPDVTVEAKLDARVCIDEQEIGRATGATAVRNGERGKGPPMPATQRGRVLRNGLEVTPLRPSEVF